MAILHKEKVWRLLAVWVAVCWCVLHVVAVADAAGFDKKKILILNSYHPGYKGSDDILRGFRGELFKALPDTELHVEYLDAKNYSGAEFDRKIADLLHFKYQHHFFDLIVATDDYAFDTLEKFRSQIFRDTPVVFCGTNSFDRSRLAGQKGMVGIDERPSFADTLALIFKIHPATTNVVVIHDNSETGQLNVKEFRQAASGYGKKITFTYFDGFRMEELATRVAQLQSGSVVMYFASFAEDRAGERISSGDALQAISAISKVPIYGGWEFNLGRGIVGGRLVNLSEHGALAATLAIRLLKGEPAAELTSLSPSPNRYMFDYAELTRFKISETLLPSGSMIIKKPPGFFWLHRVKILAVLSTALLAALLVIFAALLRSRRNLKEHRDELTRRNGELEAALANVRQLEGIIPICMYCKNIRDDMESWHQLETYISKHSDAMFSHGICPACEEKAKQDLLLL